MQQKRFTTTEIFFLLLWTGYSAAYFLLSASELSVDFQVGTLFRNISWGIVVLLILALCVTGKWTRTKCAQLIVVLALLVMVEVTRTDRNLLILILFLLLGQNMDMGKLLRYDIKLKLVLLAIILGMCALGIVENYASDFYSGYKQSLGFSHPNVLTCYVLTILVEWLCLRFRKMKWYDWVGILAAWAVVMEIGGGRASGYTFLVIYVLFILAALFPRMPYSLPAKGLFVIATPVLALVSFLGAEYYGRGNSLVIWLDEVLSGRFRYANQALAQYGVKLWGQEIEFTGTRMASMTHSSAFLVDNAYVNCAITWGGIILALLLILYVWLFVKLLRMHRVEYALMSLFFVILGLGETYMLNALYNVTLLCILGVTDRREPRSDSGTGITI